MTWAVLLLGMAPLLASGASYGGLDRDERDDAGFLRSGSRRSLGKPGARSLQDEPTCRNGMIGWGSSGGSGDFCCPVGCGACGGPGCTEFGKDSGFDMNDCCTGPIFESEVICSDETEPPCMITDDDEPKCRNGLVGIGSSNGSGRACCDVDCGLCGGDGCSSAGSAYGLDEHDCCASAIFEEGKMCSEKMEAPCVIDDVDSDSSSEDDDDDGPAASTTERRYTYEDCLANGDGAYPFFFNTSRSSINSPPDCYNLCVSQEPESLLYFALSEGNFCHCGDLEYPPDSSDTRVEGVCDIPCNGDSSVTCGGADSFDLYHVNDLDATCSNGVFGVESESGNVCCDVGCGMCGGARCIGDGDCCEHTVQLRDEMCEDVGVAPCIINKVEQATPAPSTLPTPPPQAPTSCTLDSAADIPGLMSDDGTTCCEETCSECLAANEDCIGILDCCASSIQGSNVMCADSVEGPCIISPYDGSLATPTPVSIVIPVSDNGNYDDDDNDDDDETPAASATERRYTHQDCLANGDGAYPFFFNTSRSSINSPPDCYNLCVSQERERLLYFALSEGNFCHCGDLEYLLDSSDTRVEGVCDIPCTGDSSVTCGGADSFDLYHVNDLDATCSNGVFGVESESGDVCCDVGCGMCGGARCIGDGDCCEHTVQLRDEMCEDVGVAPCIINKVEQATPAPAPVIPPPMRAPTFCALDSAADIPGLMSEDGSTCCAEICPECLPANEDCIGILDCCASEIQSSNIMCADSVEGPCIISSSS
ncbi:unnamed protein product [Pylaiella littoralis]